MITINMEKAKAVGHKFRRSARDQEFKPYDEIIMKQIPGNGSATAEAARADIRAKYAEIQNQIDSAKTPDEIKAALGL